MFLRRDCIKGQGIKEKTVCWMQCDAFSMFFSHDWSNLEDPLCYSFPDAWWEMGHDTKTAAWFWDFGASTSISSWNTQLCFRACATSKTMCAGAQGFRYHKHKPTRFVQGSFREMWETILATMIMTVQYLSEICGATVLLRTQKTRWWHKKMAGVTCLAHAKTHKLSAHKYNQV